MTSRETIKRIKEDGWFEVRQLGSHKHFRHATKAGLTTIPHPVRDLPIGTLKSIERQSGVKLT